MFPIGFAVEVDPEFPADGGEAPQRIPEGLLRIGAVLRITPPGAPAWDVAVGAPNWWRTPNPAHITLISDYAGYVLDVVERRIVIEVPGAIRVVEDQLHDQVLLVTETDVTSVGVHGELWQSERLAWDDLKVTAIGKDEIRLTGYIVPAYMQDEITVDPRTGAQLSGPIGAFF